MSAQGHTSPDPNTAGASSETPPLSLLQQRIRERRWIGVVIFLGTFYIAALPTAYTLFGAELSSDDPGLRPYLAGLWIGFALFVGAVAGLRDRRMRRILGRLQSANAKLISRRREDAVLRAVQTLLTPGAAGLSPAFRFRAFIPDREGTLVPVYEPHAETWQRWRSGHGAVGVKWKNPEPQTMVLLDTEAKLASLAGTLTAEQRKRYEHLTMVGAQIILNEEKHPIGVLGVSCEDGSDFIASGGVQATSALASTLGVLLGDVIPAAA
jgi:hypothetical protein